MSEGPQVFRLKFQSCPYRSPPSIHFATIIIQLINVFLEYCKDIDQQWIRMAVNFTEIQHDANTLKNIVNIAVKKIDLQEAEIAIMKEPINAVPRRNGSLAVLLARQDLKIKELEHMLETSPSSKFMLNEHTFEF